ncbi:MAG: hypothetical protein ACLRH0_05255 [Blautia wexlerae]
MKLNRSKFELARARACKEQKSLEADGISRGTLCTLMAGKNARPETIGRVAKALGVDVTEIIDDID